METLVGPFAWYIRRSDNKSDLDRQRSLLLAWCQASKISVPEELKYEDTGSRDLSEKRPAFQRLLRDAEAKKRKFATILIPCLDRFGVEDMDEIGSIRRTFSKAHVCLYSIDPTEGDLTAKDQTTLFKLFMKSEASREEQVKKGARAISGKANQLAKAVSFQGGPCPYGYDKTCATAEGELLWTLHYLAPGKRVAHMPDGSTRNFIGNKNTHPVKARSDRVLLVPSRDTSRIEAVKRMFELWTKHDLALLAVCKKINNEGHRHYGELWKPTAVRDLLSNPVYTGKIVFNRLKVGRFASIEQGQEVRHSHKDKHTRYKRDESKWIIVPNAHDPLIDSETWERSERKMKTLAKSKTIAPRHPDLWLRRFAVCGHCGQPMQARHIGGHPYLMCGKRKKEVSYGAEPTCAFNSVRHEVVERIVNDHFGELFTKLVAADVETVKRLMEQAESRLGLARGRTREIAADFVPFAAAYGICNADPAKVYSALLDRAEADAAVMEALAEFVAERDERLNQELAELEEQHRTVTARWALASSSQAPTLKAICDDLEGRIGRTRESLFQQFVTDSRNRLNEFTAITAQISEAVETLSNGDGTAKGEALKDLVQVIRLHFKPKTGHKAKSRIDFCQFVYCDSSESNATAYRGPRTGRSVRAGSSGCW